MSSSPTPEFARQIASAYDALRVGDGYDGFVARLVRALSERELHLGRERAERELGDEVLSALRSLLAVARAGP
jgi:hypothetical protein